MLCRVTPGSFVQDLADACSPLPCSSPPSSELKLEDRGESFVDKIKPFMLDLEALKQENKPKIPERLLEQLSAMPQYVDIVLGGEKLGEVRYSTFSRDCRALSKS